MLKLKQIKNTEKIRVYYLCIKHVFKPKFKENLKLFCLTLFKSCYTVCPKIFVASIFFF